MDWYGNLWDEGRTPNNHLRKANRGIRLKLRYLSIRNSDTRENRRENLTLEGITQQIQRKLVDSKLAQVGCSTPSLTALMATLCIPGLSLSCLNYDLNGQESVGQHTENC